MHKDLTAVSVGIVVNSILAAGKIAAGLLAGSVAVTADGLHSLTDLIGSIAVFAGLKVASKPPDECHPYGHLKAESVAVKVVGLVIIGAGINVILIGGIHIISGRTDVPELSALVVIAISVLMKEMLYQYQIRVAVKTGSIALRAAAWEQRADVLSSVVVMAGLGVSMVGFPAADALAGIIVGVLIARIGWSFLSKAVFQLMDGAASSELTAEIDAIAGSVQGVSRIGQIRTRLAGRGVFVDATICVCGQMTVSDAHRIAERVSMLIRNQSKSVVDVIVHVEPEKPTG